MATATIRKVANLLTTQKLLGKIAVDQDFICYAVDWSLPPDEALHELMLQCGMSPETLKKWQLQGVFIPGSD